MRDPIAYTYEADTHCPACAVARFGQERICPLDCDQTHPGLHSLNGGAHWYYAWPPEDARDGEGNPVGAIAPWEDWCDGEDPGVHTLACGTCYGIIEQHGQDAVLPCPDRDPDHPWDWCPTHGQSCASARKDA